MKGPDFPAEIVVASGKGGVGKSMITSSLTVLLAEKGFHLVAADADAEAPNLHLALGVTEWDNIIPYREGRVAYILREKCTSCGLCYEACQFGAIEKINDYYVINQWICEGCYTCSLVCPVKAIRYKRDLIAGWIRIKNKTVYGFPLVSGEITPGRPNSGKLVTEVKNRAKQILGSSGVLLIDAAAGIGCQVVSSIAGAHMAILVVEPTPASFHDFKRIHRLTKHFGIPSAMIINKYDINPDYIDVLVEYAEKENIDLLGMIPYDENVPKTLNQLKPLVKAYPETPASKALYNIASRLEDILDNIREWRLKYLPEKIEPFIPLIIKPESLKQPLSPGEKT